MVMCSKCHKRVAVVFATKLENGNKVSEGLCLKCAKTLGIPVDTYTVMLEPVEAPGAAPLGWQMLKQEWESLKTDEITIHIPGEAILLLRD